SEYHQGAKVAREKWMRSGRNFSGMRGDQLDIGLAVSAARLSICSLLDTARPCRTFSKTLTLGPNYRALDLSLATLRRHSGSSPAEFNGLCFNGLRPCRGHRCQLAAHRGAPASDDKVDGKSIPKPNPAGVYYGRSLRIRADSAANYLA